jgi:putative OPT family oligopeptide transporter
MVVAGIYSIIKISGSMGNALRTAFHGIRGKVDSAELPRNERDITGKTLGVLLIASMALSAVVYFIMTKSGVVTSVTTIVMFILAFFFVAVASYIVGLVGSSNSPVSGMTICTVLATAALLLVFGYTGTEGMLATLGVAGVVCCAASTAGDICQDLKIGHIVGATPRALQTGEIIGAIVPALVIAPTMQLLYSAYGIVTPAREGVQALKAPQGVMFEKLVGGIFGAGGAIPWNLVYVGAAVGVAAILIDRIFLEPRDAAFRLHAMPLAVGMYLPWTVTFPILIGGAAYLFVDHRSRRNGDSPELREKKIHQGLLYSSGLVAGEAIGGILIAILVVSNMKMPLMPESWTESGALIEFVSLAALLGATWWVIRKAITAKL